MGMTEQSGHCSASKETLPGYRGGCFFLLSCVSRTRHTFCLSASQDNWRKAMSPVCGWCEKVGMKVVEVVMAMERGSADIVPNNLTQGFPVGQYPLSFVPVPTHPLLQSPLVQAWTGNIPGERRSVEGWLGNL